MGPVPFGTIWKIVLGQRSLLRAVAADHLHPRDLPGAYGTTSRHVPPPGGRSVYDSDHNLDDPDIARRSPAAWS